MAGEVALVFVVVPSQCEENGAMNRHGRNNDALLEKERLIGLRMLVWRPTDTA